MPFDAVAETLLKGGIAPRRVRRYVRELNDHLEDLLAQQRAAGASEAEALAHACGRMGGDAELAQAMLDQPGMKSWPARLPWLVFLLLPPAALLVAATPLYLLFYFLGDGAAKISAVLPLPQNGLIAFSVAAMTAVNILTPPLSAAILVWMAMRQRLNIVWPLLGIAVVIVLSPEFGYKFGHHHDGFLSIGYGLFVPSARRDLTQHGALTISHLLALLPALWLIRRRKSIA